LSGLNIARDHGRWALSSAVEHYLDMKALSIDRAGGYGDGSGSIEP
jgi:hypothetical protein